MLPRVTPLSSSPRQIPQLFKIFSTEALIQHVLISDGKDPSLLEFGSVRVLPNIRVRSVRVLSSYGKMKVQFGFSSLWRVFGSVRFYVSSQMNIYFFY